MGINMRLVKNNDGITMVELIITLGITAIVLTMIAIVISTAAKSFRHTTNNTNLQKEAQVTLNQLGTILMEAGSITNGTAVSPDIKYLIQGSGDSSCYAIYLKADEDRLYLIPADDITIADSINPTEDEDTEYQYLLAEYVDSFSIETGTNSANIVIKFVLGASDYTVNKRITMRNQ
jgi:type II secretory pathway pseudopilin PulG